MRLSLLLAALLALAACDEQPKQNIAGNRGTAVNTQGDVNITTCKPSFGAVNAPVKIECGPGIPPAALAKLEAYLTEQLRSSRNLNELVERQRQEIADWEKKYREQTQNLAQALALMPDDQLLQAAQQALKAGDLEKAAQLREQRFRQWEEKATARLAAEAYQVGLAYQLAYQPLQALPYLEKAYRYQPGEFDYGFEYAFALRNQNQRQNAEAVYQDLLKTARAEASKAGRVALIFNNLGMLVADDSRRRGEAEGIYQEALKAYRELARDDPAVYQPYLATTLHALGFARLQWKNPQQARTTLQEAADLLRPYARQQTGVFGDKQAHILYLLALADGDARRACTALAEALELAQREDWRAAISEAHQVACRPSQSPARRQH